MDKEELFRNACIEYLQLQLEEERKKRESYGEVVKKQRKASEEVKILLETMPKEAEEVIEKYVDSVFATAIEDWLLIYHMGARDMVELFQSIGMFRSEIQLNNAVWRFTGRGKNPAGLFFMQRNQGKEAEFRPGEDI